MRTITLSAQELRILIRALSAHESHLNERAIDQQDTRNFNAALDEAEAASKLRVRINGVADD